MVYNFSTVKTILLSWCTLQVKAGTVMLLNLLSSFANTL
jgi:hypothetical protein